MNDETNYTNNPLHGVGLKKLLTEIVDHYGFDILFAYLNINCFNSNPSIQSSVKFLKKTDWAREKVEAFYLYEFKNLPRASAAQFELSPRDRIVPPDQKAGEPAVLSLEDAKRLREKRAKKAAMRDQKAGDHPDSATHFGSRQSGKHSNQRETDNAPEDDCKPAKPSVQSDSDPWAKWKKK